MSQLSEIFDQMRQVPHGENAYRARRCSESIFFGLDSNSQPSLFIKENTSGRKYALETSNISIGFSQEYSMVFSEGTAERFVGHKISCKSQREQDVRTFLSIMQSYIDNASVYDLTNDGLTDFFYSLVRLFKIQPDSDTTTARQGLWGELFMMKTFRGYDFWTKHWHSDPLNIFDFSKADKRIEVKTTTNQERIHQFSHSQLFSGDEVRVVSIMLQREDSGTALRALIEEAREIFRKSPHYFKLEKAIRKAGMDDLNESGPIFSASHALGNLAGYAICDIPRFPIAEPEGVSGTHYRSDLTGATRLGNSEIDAWITGWDSEVE